MSSPFAVGPAAPPPPPRQANGRWIGIAIAAVVVLLALAVVIAVQASNQHTVTGPAPTTTAPLPGASTTTTSSAASPGGGTGVVESACTSVAQPFPLPSRGCRILSPPNVTAGEKLPVVFVLHGFNTSADQERSTGHWDAAVVRDRFIAAFPQGDFNSWNAGGCCGLAKSASIDDVGYLQALVTGIQQRPDVDRSRIFMVGESNGGMMTYRFLCQHADELAGAASSEGTSVAGCEPNAPIRFLHIHGRDDNTVPYDGGQSLVAWVLGVTFTTVQSSVQRLATAEGCGAPSTHTAGSVTTETWDGCGTGGPVQLVTLDGWGHSWPTGSYDATAQILHYFGLAS